MMNTTDSIAVGKPEVKTPLRLEFLDGMRGLAAFYILLFHAFCHSRDAFPAWAFPLVQIVADGKYAVGIFIVLSGFCLMLPIVRSKDLALKGGFYGYIGRRMRRILPPYYAALAIALIPIALTQLPKYIHGQGDRIANPVTIGNIISHIFLVHNLNAAWAGTIDGPMWSVSTEWEIYFLLPLILLPAWKRTGNVGVVVCGFVLGLLPYTLPFRSTFSQAYFGLIGLFAIGMASAAFCFSDKYSERFLKYGRFAGVYSLVAYGFLVIAGMIVKQRGELMHIDIWTWMFLLGLVGISFGCLIIYCCHQSRFSKPNPAPILRALKSNIAVWLGTFSYSLYLTHEVVFNLSSWALDRHHVSRHVSNIAVWFFELPIALIIAYLFHLIFEKPFLVPSIKPSPISIANDGENCINVLSTAQ